MRVVSLLLTLLFWFETTVASYAQNEKSAVTTSKLISGKVVDQDNTPLPGVSVRYKGTTLGVSTDINGNYSIGMSDASKVLVFSFIGMATQEVACDNREVINVVMSDDAKQIDAVVVNGMFTRRAESFTGAAATFRREDLLRVGNQNLIKSLKNLDPSFQIMENLDFGSDPNHMPDVQMRGQTSLNNLQGDYEGNPNQPLFILDGFETSIEKVFDLDMNRVASITLLKDAAAKAIYGSKAGNGVVVIETIRPKTGQLQIHYSGDFGIEAPDLSGYDLMNAAEKLAYEVKVGMYGPNNENDLGTITAYDSYKKVYDDVLRGVDTYWLSQPLRTGFSQKHSLNLEGGDERMRYLLGLSFNDVAGVMKESGRKTLNLNTTLSYTYKKFLFRNTMDFSRNWSKNSPYGSFSTYTELNPYWAPYDENGNLVKVFTVHHGQNDTDPNASSNVYNPLYNATLNTKDETGYTEFRDNFSVDWTINSALRMTGTLSYTRKELSSDVFLPAGHTMFATYDANGLSDRKGRYTKGDGTQDNIEARVGMNFNKTFGHHLLFANLTYNIASQQTSMVTTVAEGFGNDYMDDITFATKYEEFGRPSGSTNRLREIGVIGALSYSYADRYLLDASLRRSASSAYGSDNRWGTFWSLGAGWNVHHEKFLEDNDWIRQLKLRASMGYTGTQNINPSQSRARYHYSDYVYDDRFGALLVGLPNDKLKWQRNMDYNVGVDFSLKNFLTLRADYYIQRTDDLLSSITLPQSTGFPSYTENLGKIENKGYEIALSVTPWRDNKRNGYLTFSATAMHNKNQIKKIYDIFKYSNDKQNTALDGKWTDADGKLSDPNTVKNLLNKYKPKTLYYEGCSMTAIWGMQSLGIDPATGKEMFLTKDGKRTFTWSSAEQVVVGDATPKLRGSLGLNGGYKGFTFSVVCSYKFGGDLYNSELIARMENVSGWNNLDRRVFDAWQKPGDIAPYKVVVGSNSSAIYDQYTKPTSRFVQKDNELYVSSLSVGYDFAMAKWLSRSFLKRLKLSFYTNELVRLSSVKVERGLSYPFARNFSFSIQASF